MLNRCSRRQPKRLPDITKERVDVILLGPVSNPFNDNEGIFFDENPLGMQFLYDPSDACPCNSELSL